jgi:NADPH2:quinone reductase
MKAIRVQTPGGIEALRYEDVATPTPKTGEALVMIEAVGINFVDIYIRSGMYKNPLPLTLGQEGAGIRSGAARRQGLSVHHPSKPSTLYIDA